MGSVEKLPKMQYRFLGRSGLQVSVISLGGWQVMYTRLIITRAKWPPGLHMVATSATRLPSTA